MFLVPRDSVRSNWDANMTLVSYGIFFFCSFLFYQVIQTWLSSCQPQIVKAQETLSQSIQNLTSKALAHALGHAVLHCCCTSFSFYGGIWQVQVLLSPFPPAHPLSPPPPMNTDLSTLFSFIVLLLGFASWIYRWLFLACFIIYGACSLGIVHGGQHLFDIFSTESFPTKYGKVFVYDFVVVLLVLGMWDVVVILCCNRMKLRTSLFFNTKKNCWHPKEREREHDTTAALIIKWYVFEFGM
jgi:hypothetical protein